MKRKWHAVMGQEKNKTSSSKTQHKKPRERKVAEERIKANAPKRERSSRCRK